MGSAPSKVPPRSRSGLSFVSSSSVESLTSLTTEVDDETDYESATNFKFDEIECKTFTVKWSPPPLLNVESYQVRIFPPDKIRSRTLIRAIPNPEYKFHRLHSGTSYTVGVIAIQTNGKKAACSTAQISTLPRPPRDLQFPSKATSSALEVKWRHSKGKRDSYSASIKPEEGVTSPTHVTGITGNSHVFGGLVPGTEYTVSVQTVANGVASESLTGSIITAPRHVCDVSFIDVTQYEMTVKWKVPEGNVESYRLELSEANNTARPPFVLSKLTTTNYSFNGLTPGRLYNLEITCISSNSKSKPMKFSQCTIPSEVHDILAKDVGPEQVTVTWSPAHGDVDDYDLFLTPKEGTSCDTSPTAIKEPRYKFTGLVPGTTYKVGIVTNSQDKSSKRAVSTFITEPGMSGKLQFPKPEQGSNCQKVKWQPSLGRTDSYIVYARRDDKKEEGWRLADLYDAECLLEKLTPGTKYRVEVMSMRDGRESSSLADTFLTDPLPVESVLFQSDKCSWDKISCKWARPSGGVETFHLTLVTEGRTVMEKSVPGDATEYTFCNLMPSTVYEIAVAVESNDIESVPVWGKHKTGPGAISGLKLDPGDKRELVAKWTSPEGGAEDYVLNVDSMETGDRSAPITVEETQTEHLFSDLQPGSRYRVSVTSRSRHISGPTVTAEAHTKPGNVLNVHIPVDDITKESILVTWWGVEGNCKSVDVTLTRLRNQHEDEDVSAMATIVKQDRIEECKNGLNEYKFKNLEEGTVYGIRLCASGESGTGDDVVLTQATLSTTPVREEHIPPPEVKADSPVPVVLEKIEEPVVDETTSEVVEEKVAEDVSKLPEEPTKVEEPLVPVVEEVVIEPEVVEEKPVTPPLEVVQDPAPVSEVIEPTEATEEDQVKPESIQEENETTVDAPEKQVHQDPEPEPVKEEPKPPTPIPEEVLLVEDKVSETSTPEEKTVEKPPSPAEQKSKTPSPLPEETKPPEEPIREPTPEPELEPVKKEERPASNTPDSVASVASIKPVLVIEDITPRSSAPEGSVESSNRNGQNGPTVTFADLQSKRKSPSPQPNGKSAMSLLVELTSD